MVWTIVVVLLLLWGIGLVSSYTFGGLLHLLLVIALAMVAARLLSGPRVAKAGAQPRKGA